MTTTLAMLATWITGSVVSAEFLGYWLHRLLHSGAIGVLSRSHMRHHLLLYGPLQEQRTRGYRDATTGSLALGNIGTEWIVPALVLIVASAGLFHLLRIRALYQEACFATTLSWSFLMFSKLHDVMHVKDFWLEKSGVLKHWFLRARRRHDLHHFAINDAGLMNKNFGIGFYLFDRLFGTLSDTMPVLNRKGYAEACQRFKSLLNS